MDAEDVLSGILPHASIAAPGEQTPATYPLVILIAKTLMLSTRENGIFCRSPSFDTIGLLFVFLHKIHRVSFVEEEWLQHGVYL